MSAPQPMPAGTSTHPAASFGMAVLAVHVLPDYAPGVSHGLVPVFNCMRVNDSKSHLIGLHPYELPSLQCRQTPANLPLWPGRFPRAKVE